MTVLIGTNVYSIAYTCSLLTSYLSIHVKTQFSLHDNIKTVCEVQQEVAITRSQLRGQGVVTIVTIVLNLNGQDGSTFGRKNVSK